MNTLERKRKTPKKERRAPRKEFGALKSDVPDVVRTLNNEYSNISVKKRAARALENSDFEGVELKDKVFALLVLEKTDDVVEMGEAAMPFLIDMLKNIDSPVEVEASSALGKIIEQNSGYDVKETAYSLKDALDVPHELAIVRYWLTRGLGHIARLEGTNALDLLGEMRLESNHISRVWRNY